MGDSHSGLGHVEIPSLGIAFVFAPTTGQVGPQGGPGLVALCDLR